MEESSMRGTRRLAAVVVLVGVGLTPVGHAAARGFCNVDRIGTGDLQAAVAKASATFYTAVSAVMQMLAAIEEGSNKEEVHKFGADAVRGFSAASKEYATAVKYVDDRLGRKIAEVNLELVMRLSQVYISDPTVNKLTNFVKEKKPEELVKFCSDQSSRMETETNEFNKSVAEIGLDKIKEQNYTKLLITLNGSLYYGGFISMIFAVAGGETP